MLIKNSEQHSLKTGRDTCDMCGFNTVPYTKRYAFVTRGATGRACEVLWVCDNCGNDGATDVAEARKIIDAELPGSVDF